MPCKIRRGKTIKRWKTIEKVYFLEKYQDLNLSKV